MPSAGAAGVAAHSGETTESDDNLRAHRIAIATTAAGDGSETEDDIREPAPKRVRVLK